MCLPDLKFIYSEKATNVCKISTVDLLCVVMVKSIVEISQNFVAFSEYMNFKRNQLSREHIVKEGQTKVHKCKVSKYLSMK